MISSLFEWMSISLNSNFLLALAGAFTWGVMSILLSPCHLASIPLVIGLIDDQGKVSIKKAFVLSFLFSFGILATIGFVGFVTNLMGRMLGDIGNWGNYLVAIIFFVMGLHLMDMISLPLFSGISNNARNARKINNKGFFILGLVFGIALGPCTFAYMAPILGVTFTMARTNFLYSLLLLLMYGVGHCSVIIVAGTSTELVQRYLNWNEKSKGTVFVKRICGLLVILGGVYLIISSL